MQSRLLTPGREPMAYQSMDAIKVQHGDSMSFIGVTYRNKGERLLTGTEMTPRQLYLSLSPTKA